MWLKSIFCGAFKGFFGRILRILWLKICAQNVGMLFVLGSVCNWMHTLLGATLYCASHLVCFEWNSFVELVLSETRKPPVASLVSFIFVTFCLLSTKKNTYIHLCIFKTWEIHLHEWRYFFAEQRLTTFEHHCKCNVHF